MVKTAVVFNLIENLHHERGKQLWFVAYSSHSSQFYSFFKLFYMTLLQNGFVNEDLEVLIRFKFKFKSLKRPKEQRQ